MLGYNVRKTPSAGYQNAAFVLFGTHLRASFARLQLKNVCCVADKLKFWVPNGVTLGALVPIFAHFTNFRLQK